MEPMKREPVRVVALASGGVESAVLLKELLAEGHTVIPCYVKAGFSWEPQEQRALERVLEALAHERLEEIALLNLPVDDCYKEHWSLTGRAVPDAASPDGECRRAATRWLARRKTSRSKKSSRRSRARYRRTWR